MPETLIPIIKGDKTSVETDYRDALPINMTAVSRPILNATGYMLSHPGIESFGDGIGGGREESVSIHIIASGQYASIATREVDKILSEYTESELSDAVLETRVQDGDAFLIARLPNHTLLYNATIARDLGKNYAWTLVQTGLSGAKWRGANGVYDPRVSKWIYGDNQDGRIGSLNKTIASQYGEKTECIIFTPLVNLESASIDEFELQTIPGHQPNLDDVTCAVSLTYDGITYTNEWWALYGQSSRYGVRFIVRRAGYVREYVGFKIRSVSESKTSYNVMRLVYG